MQISMKDLEKLSLSEMEDLLAGSRKITWTSEDTEAKYNFISAVLKQHSYSKLGKRERGVVRRFLAKAAAISRAQMTRLVAQWMEHRSIKRKPARRSNFVCRYQEQDVHLLAATDAAHEDLSGPALRRILQREHQVFKKPGYERLSQISVSHIYNLRRSAVYRQKRVRVQHTQSRQIPIGDRRKPDPKGKPGYLRVDTVHQGTHDGKAGVFHINAVDTVTQWQAIGCVETISERHMIPVLEAILHQFPFRILGFHCDNGSEFINQNVAGMLEKLLIEFTKSRAYRTTDNALVEGKNGAVVRKHIGYGFIASDHAAAIQRFYTAHFNPYLNFHRPCGYAVLKPGTRGRTRRVYAADDYCTPFEKLSSLPRCQLYLKPGVTAALLGEQATRHSDTEAAKLMQTAKLDLLKRVRLER
jgi:transposase InsO family protein